MLTKAQALTADEFHAGTCVEIVGPRGGRKVKREVWRRNGRTQTWKTRPDDFRVPVKHGLYAYGQITQAEANLIHTAEDCPISY